VVEDNLEAFTAEIKQGKAGRRRKALGSKIQLLVKVLSLDPQG